MSRLNWNRLNDAMNFYQNRGYEAIDVPWVVSPAASNSTKPAQGVNLEVVPDHTHGTWGVLPASGEQGFVELMFQGKLKGELINRIKEHRGRFVTLTPCFRQEPAYHGGTCPWFMKVELILVGEASRLSVLSLLNDAQEFMDRYSLRRTEVVEMGPDMWDIELNGVEVGSYGPRVCGEYAWTYGTGIAEPRFAWALKAARYDDVFRPPV